MSVGHCMNQALAIAQKPLDQWATAIDAVTEQCGHADCGEPRNCRVRVAEYLRVQYKMRQRRDARERAAAR